MEKTIKVDKKYISPSLGKSRSKPKMKPKPSKGLTRKHLLKKLKKLSSKYPSLMNKNGDLTKGSETTNQNASKQGDVEEEYEVNDQFKESLHALDEMVKHYNTRKNKKLNKSNVNESVGNLSENGIGPNVLDTSFDTCSGNVNTTSPSSVIKSLDKRENITPRNKSPRYGCLKFGTKPTFRQLNKTKRNKTILFPKSNLYHVATTGDMDAKLQSRKELLEQVKHQVKEELDGGLVEKSTTINTNTNTNINENGNTNSISSNLLKPKTKILHRVKKTRRVGRKGNKVVILIDNNKTRKKKADEIVKLNNMPLSKVKAYLRSKMLIKSVCNAPEHILREMMKNSILSGDVSNHPDSLTIDHYLDRDKVGEENEFIFGV